LDAYEAKILDLLMTKSNAIRLATDAAVTVLRVDQIIMAKPAGGPKPPKQGAIDED
jgi:T-complex protein 1 subunit theta